MLNSSNNLLKVDLIKTFYKIWITSLIGVLFFAISGCIQEPDMPDRWQNNETLHGALILCEGLWKLNNSSLDKFNFELNRAELNYFSSVNPGYEIGDLGNHLVTKGDTGYIAVTGSRTIEIFNIRTGVTLGRIILDGNSGPRRLIIINDSTAYVTDFYGECVHKFNPTTFLLTKVNIRCGPAPEGMTSLNQKLYVANSGAGDLLQTKPKASTISVIDINTDLEVANYSTGLNPILLQKSFKRNTIYVMYKNLPSEADSLGGIIEYDADNFREIRSWRLKPQDFAISSSEDTLFVLSSNRFYLIVLNMASEPELVIDNSKSTDNWYSFSMNPFDNTIWISNAKNFQVSGEIEIFNLGSKTKLFSFEVGINPNTILFY